MAITGFYWVLPIFTGFESVLPGFTGFCIDDWLDLKRFLLLFRIWWVDLDWFGRVLLGFNGTDCYFIDLGSFYCNNKDFDSIDRCVPSFTGFLQQSNRVFLVFYCFWTVWLSFFVEKKTVDGLFFYGTECRETQLKKTSRCWFESLPPRRGTAFLIENRERDVVVVATG